MHSSPKSFCKEFAWYPCQHLGYGHILKTNRHPNSLWSVSNCIPVGWSCSLSLSQQKIPDNAFSFQLIIASMAIFHFHPASLSNSRLQKVFHYPEGLVIAHPIVTPGNKYFSESKFIALYHVTFGLRHFLEMNTLSQQPFSCNLHRAAAAAAGKRVSFFWIRLVLQVCLSMKKKFSLLQSFLFALEKKLYYCNRARIQTCELGFELIEVWGK